MTAVLACRPTRFSWRTVFFRDFPETFYCLERNNLLIRTVGSAGRREFLLPAGRQEKRDGVGREIYERGHDVENGPGTERTECGKGGRSFLQIN